MDQEQYNQDVAQHLSDQGLQAMWGLEYQEDQDQQSSDCAENLQPQCSNDGVAVQNDREAVAYYTMAVQSDQENIEQDQENIDNDCTAD